MIDVIILSFVWSWFVASQYHGCQSESIICLMPWLPWHEIDQFTPPTLLAFMLIVGVYRATRPRVKKD